MSAEVIPRVGAEWVVQQLPGRGQEWIAQIVLVGLKVLAVKELKELEGPLYSRRAVVEEASIRVRRLRSGALKQERVDFLRRAFYRDDLCKIRNEGLLQDLQAELRLETTPVTSSGTADSSTVSRVGVAASSYTPGSAFRTNRGSRKRSNQEISSQAAQRPLHPPPWQPGSMPPGQTPTDIAYHMAQYFRRHYPPSHPNFPPWLEPPRGSNGGFNPDAYFGNGSRDYPNSSGLTTPAANGTVDPPASSSTTTTSTANNSDPDSTPQTPTESLLLPQLQEMGFDKQEILDGIRHHCSTNPSSSPTAEDVMLHLVYLREEAEEARREDQVRLASEDQKQEEAQRRERTQTDALAKARTCDDLCRIFPDSWILKESSCSNTNTALLRILAAANDTRTDLIEILKLEEKSRKWYGWKLPEAYFIGVADELRKGGNNAPDFLCSERIRLRSGLYELEEQCNGQPKLFLDERPAAANGESEIVIIDDDDEG